MGILPFRFVYVNGSGCGFLDVKFGFLYGLEP